MGAAEQQAVRERGVTVYEARDGQEIKLSFDTIKRYLVQGHPEMVTDQEMMFFMGVCKSRGLNPFIKDAYLIKYSPNEGAAIITSIDYFRKRAKAQRDCKGWKKGIIVERKGEVVYSNGLMMDGDKLLGGWFEGQPEGWTEPQRLEVNLKGYIKRTKAGEITKFWAPENQPSQIMKVAESQGLRTLWPDEFQQLYTPEEMGDADMFHQAEGKPPKKAPVEMEPTGEDVYKVREAPKEPPAPVPEQGKAETSAPPEAKDTMKAEIVDPGAAQEGEKKRGRPAGSANKPKEPLQPDPDPVVENDKQDPDAVAFMTEALQYKDTLPDGEWKKLLQAFQVNDPRGIKPTMRAAFLRTAKTRLEKSFEK